MQMGGDKKIPEASQYKLKSICIPGNKKAAELSCNTLLFSDMMFSQQCLWLKISKNPLNK